MVLQDTANSGVIYDRIYPYLHNLLKALVKPVCHLLAFCICNYFKLKMNWHVCSLFRHNPKRFGVLVN